MRPVLDIAEGMGLDLESVIPYGAYKAKINLEAIRPGRPKGKLVVVTGITPTPAGEGKTTTTIALTQGLAKLGERAIATLREPSLGPMFGVKGGGTGGGKSRVVPEDEINIHFTGDAHAVGTAHNLLAALVDNAVHRGLVSDMNPDAILWRRVSDVQDRALRIIATGLGGTANAPLRETGFDIVAASEIMAILALSTDMTDLRERLGRIVVGLRRDGTPVTANDVGAVGSMMSLLRYALLPNLVQTLEGQPVIVHTGPFGNIAHGCSSIVADRLALGYADFVITEAGFGADLGFEKFMHIKTRSGGAEPHAGVLVATIRALRSHGGASNRDLDTPNIDALRKGLPNLTHLIGVVRAFGLPVVVAINRFPSDTTEEIALLKEEAKAAGAHAVAESRGFAEGGEGAIDLAEAVVAAVEGSRQGPVTYLYPQEATAQDKVLALARQVYAADGVEWSGSAARRLRTYDSLGWTKLPICMAKTHLSLSHDRRLGGRPGGYTFSVSDVRASLGAGFIYPIAGSVMTMPGLPAQPRQLDVDEHGRIVGL